MDGRRVSASDVVRDAEASLGRSAALREEARRLMAAADAMDAETRAMAVAALGEALGNNAFELALLSVGGAPATQPVAAREYAAAVPPAPVPPPTEVPGGQEQSRPPERQDQPAGPAHEFFHGIKIPAQRRSEAEEIVAEARGLVAQGKKQNPYAADRGKNAWRGNLFRAVLAESSASAPPPATDPRGSHGAGPPDAPAPVPPVPAPVPAPAPAARAEPAGDPLDDLLPQDSAGVGGEAGERVQAPADLPSADPPPERLESHPVPPTRRAGFNNSVPKPPGLTEAQSRAGARTPLLSRRPPSFVQR